MGEYIIIKTIGRGSFGTIYSGKRNNKIYAVKYQKKNNYSLLTEYKIMKSLQNIDCVPRIDIYNIEEDLYSYYGMQLLDITLIDYYDKMYNRGKNTTKMIKDIFVNMINIIRSVHDNGILHGDLKPENFMFDTNMKLYIIDFGLSKYYMINNKHIPLKHVSQTTGSLHYMSLNNHNLLEISRRDDLIALFYNFICILSHKLPWSHSRSHRNIKNLKINITINNLCNLIHTNFIDFYNYLIELQFTETPDYDYLINIIKNIDKVFL